MIRFWYTLKNLHPNGCWVTQAIGPPSYYPSTLAFIIPMKILLELNKKVIVEKSCHNINLHIHKHQGCKYIIYSWSWLFNFDLVIKLVINSQLLILFIIGCRWIQTSQNWCQNINFSIIFVTFVYVVPF
jgi:hypothetical protein